MNPNTFGKTMAANDLVKILVEEDVTAKTIRTIGRKLTNYNRGLNAIIKINDHKIKNQLLKIWREISLDEIEMIGVSENVYTHIRNVELAYLRRKAYNSSAA